MSLFVDDVQECSNGSPGQCRILSASFVLLPATSDLLGLPLLLTSSPDHPIYVGFVNHRYAIVIFPKVLLHRENRASGTPLNTVYDCVLALPCNTESSNFPTTSAPFDVDKECLDLHSSRHIGGGTLGAELYVSLMSVYLACPLR